MGSEMCIRDSSATRSAAELKASRELALQTTREAAEAAARRAADAERRASEHGSRVVRTAQELSAVERRVAALELRKQPRGESAPQPASCALEAGFAPHGAARVTGAARQVLRYVLDRCHGRAGCVSEATRSLHAHATSI